jgi:ATP-binding cassette subfamily B multidrug efflux pump
VLILRIVLPRLQSVSERQADARALMTGRVADSYTNIATVKLFSHAQREARYAREGMSEFLDTVHPQMRLVTWMETAVAANNTLMLLSVSATATWLWFDGSITPGAIAAALALCLRMNGISEWIMWEVSDLFENIGTVRDGINTLSLPVAVTDRKDAQPLAVSAVPSASRRGLRLRQWQAGLRGPVPRYPPGGENRPDRALRGGQVHPGQPAAALPGRPGRQSIEIDGQDIRDVTQDSLRAHIGMVTQDTSLLHRTVRENILYGRQDASEAELLSAMERARASEFIEALRDQDGAAGLDARVGERGVKLSGGQRQRIAIARVMLKDAPILVLDEATSALDSEVEVAIQDSLYALMEGKTVLAIAHRLSTIAALDRLVVLDGGRIVEQGSHAELLEHGGIYKRLWDYQSGGFLAPE